MLKSLSAVRYNVLSLAIVVPTQELVIPWGRSLIIVWWMIFFIKTFEFRSICFFIILQFAELPPLSSFKELIDFDDPRNSSVFVFLWIMSKFLEIVQGVAKWLKNSTWPSYPVFSPVRAYLFCASTDSVNGDARGWIYNSSLPASSGYNCSFLIWALWKCPFLSLGLFGNSFRSYFMNFCLSVLLCCGEEIYGCRLLLCVWKQYAHFAQFRLQNPSHYFDIKYLFIL